MKAANVKYVFSALFFRKQERNYANTDGSVIAQTIVQSAIQQQFGGEPGFLRLPEPRQHHATGGSRLGVECCNRTSSRTPPSGAKRRARSSRG
ncbi:MAG: hypothetical protein IPK33_25775 [Gemmatimonadetes bacterium]|nr:hypothetical protein [Gemmatimonadota bacterium]